MQLAQQIEAGMFEQWPRSQAPNGLAWIEAGRGVPLLLIHGVGLRAEAWSAQIHALATRYAVRAIDLPGHGESIALDRPDNLAAYSDRIAEALASMGAAALIAGHSLGALVALDLAIRYPQLCRGVAALNAIYRRSPVAAAAVLQRAKILSANAASDPSATLARWFGDDRAGEAARACRDWLLTVEPAAYKAAYRVFAQEDGPSDPGLEGLACPALFITGRAEPNSTPAMSRAMAARVPNGQAVIVEDAAHMMPMTHPDAVNRELLTFFQSCEGETL